MAELNKYSKTITQDETQPAAQAMLYGIGLTEEDLKKAQVGVVSMGYDGNTCNMHLNDLAKIVKQGVWDNDLVGLIFNTIVALPGCDKNMPGSIIAMGRLNRPAIMVYGGTIAPGHYNGQDLNIISAFEA